MKYLARSASIMALLLSVALVNITMAASPPAAADQSTVLITGSNRGIGFEFVRQFAASGWRVIATTRTPDQAVDLIDFAKSNTNIVIERLDVTDHDGVDTLAAKYAGQPIDILLLNAALGPSAKTAMAQLDTLDFELAQRHFAVNTIGPMKVAQAFIANVKASKRKQIIAMSSDSGSFVSGSQAPILFHYKASKAALNMYLHTLAFATKKQEVTVVMLHPGLVGTNPQLMKFPGAMTTQDSVRQMMQVIDGIKIEDNGRFIDYAGEPMPW